MYTVESNVSKLKFDQPGRSRKSWNVFAKYILCLDSKFMDIHSLTKVYEIRQL